MQNRIIGIFISITLVVLGFGCQQEKKPLPENVQPVPVVKNEGIPSVCIWDNASVKMEPGQSGRWMSSLALGERVMYMNENKVDTTDKNSKYLKVRLSDGKEGWVSENSLAVDSKPAVTIQRSIIYLRPDLVTITEKEFVPMEFVAASKMEGEWCEAKGQEGKKTGWIKSGTVTVREEDLTVALLVNKALAEKTKDKKKEKITSILHNPSFSGSVFIDTLKTILSKMTPRIIEEPVIDESDDSDEMEESDEEIE